MTTRGISGLLAVAALLALAPAKAFALPHVPRPELALSAGRTWAVTGAPDDGGLTFAIAPTWHVCERGRFGFVGYADDLGTQLVELFDPNDGTPLGTAAELHRWTFGAAWRAEADLWDRGPWTVGATGAWGWWRVQDDVRGDVNAAGSAVGFILGADVRRAAGRGREVGLTVRYHRLDENREVTWKRVDRYASAALEMRWKAPGR